MRNTFESSTPNTIVESYLKKFAKDGWIYPVEYSKKTSVSIIDTYSFLGEMENLGYLKGYYKHYCSHCNYSDEKLLFEVFNQLPATFTCEKCNAVDSSLISSILIYKIINQH